MRKGNSLSTTMSNTTCFNKGIVANGLALPSNVDQRPMVLSIAWNHDGTAMALGTRDGFMIYSAEMLTGDSGELVEMCRRHVDGGVLHFALYRQSSIFAFSGASRESAGTVTLWDESLADSATPFRYTQAEKCALATLTLDSAVCALRLHHHLILVADAFRIFAFSTDGLKLLETFHTPGFGRTVGAEASHGSPGIAVDNHCNTIAMATFEVHESHGISGSCSVLRMLCMGPLLGSVRCCNYYFNMKKPNVSLVDAEMPAFIDSGLVSPNPHTRAVQCLALSLDGSVGVTCSCSGTSLKVVDVRKRVVMRQLNLSSVSSRMIGSISISTDATLVSCLSSTGTIHVFSVQRWRAAGGDGSWSGAAAAAGQALLAAGLTSMKSVVPQARRLEDVSNFLEGEKAILTFSLTSDDVEVSATLRTAPRSNVSEESAAFVQEIGGEDEVRRLLDISEHNGYDPMFAALQFRPGGSIDKNSGAYGVNLLVACGSVAPHALRAKSKCLSVRVETAKGVAQLQCTSAFPKDEL